MLAHHLHTKSPSSVPDVSGVALECLSVAITQPWAEIDNLVDYDGFHHADDSLSTWDASETDILSVLSSPSASDSLTKWAEAIAVHYIPSKHLGVCHEMLNVYRRRRGRRAVIASLERSSGLNSDRDKAETGPNDKLDLL
ncbi:hypothetical protein PM082_024400 [Marasmius tenuissimus]|nr:hypothetical protein PM082_024400 [Marasmius tenuissimus]